MAAQIQGDQVDSRTHDDQHNSIPCESQCALHICFRKQCKIVCLCHNGFSGCLSLTGFSCLRVQIKLNIILLKEMMCIRQSGCKYLGIMYICKHVDHFQSWDSSSTEGNQSMCYEVHYFSLCCLFYVAGRICRSLCKNTQAKQVISTGT